MKMNRHISCAVRFLGVAAACFILSFASSCTREDPAGDDAARLSAGAFAFDLLDEEQDVLTRSVFDNVSGWSDSKKSNVTLAAYCGGVLFAKQYYSSGIMAMTLSLEKGRTYNVYALVNMGDMTSSIPDSESGSGGIASLVYNIPSYNSGSNSVSSYGIPMAGVLENLSVTASTSGTQHVPVKRLLARVTLNLTCNWPGAQIQSAKVYNLNRRLVPFGSSVAQSSSDILSGFQELTTASSPGSTLTAVLYVPENLQGTISGASTSGNKRPDAGISGITNKQSVLSYMEVYVTGASPLSGNVTYRSYLGSNATNNFDIVRNTKYVWNLTYQANGLQTDNWKVDSDITDNRRIILNGPFYLEQSETLAWSSVVNTGTNQTNIALSDLSYSFTGSQASSIVSSTSGSNLSTASAISVRSNAPIGQTATLTVTPTSNPNNIITGSAISGQTQVNVIDRVVEWKNYDQSVYGSENKKVYAVNAGSSVTAEVDFSYMWPATNGTQYFERGMRPSMWTYTTPSTGSGTSAITSSYTAGSGNTRDRITYSVGSAVAYGDYAVTVSRTGGKTGSDVAYIRVADTRYLRWTDRTGSTSYYNPYVYTETVVDASVSRGSLGTMSGNQWVQPNYYTFGDVTGSGKQQGTTVYSSMLSDYFDYTITENGVSGIPVADSEYFQWLSGYPTPSIAGLSLKKNLPAGDYALTIAYKDGSHAIVSNLHVLAVQNTRYRYVMEPAQAGVEVGGTVQFRIRRYSDIYLDDELVTPDNTGELLSQYSGSWSTGNTSVATVSAGTVTGVAVGSTSVNWKVNSSDASYTCSGTVNVTAQTVVSTEYRNLSVSITGNPAVYGPDGGSGNISWSASYERRDKYSNNTYSSWTTVTVAQNDIQVSGSAVGFTRTGNSLSVGSNGGAARKATYTASYTIPGTNISASGSVDIQQRGRQLVVSFANGQSGQISVGGTTRLVATYRVVNYDDSVYSSTDVTSSSVWGAYTSRNGSVTSSLVTVSSGLVTGQSTGTAWVGATYTVGAHTLTAERQEITVTAAPVQTRYLFWISPSTASLGLGASASFVVYRQEQTYTGGTWVNSGSQTTMSNSDFNWSLVTNTGESSTWGASLNNGTITAPSSSSAAGHSVIVRATLKSTVSGYDTYYEKTLNLKYTQAVVTFVDDNGGGLNWHDDWEHNGGEIILD